MIQCVKLDLGQTQGMVQRNAPHSSFCLLAPMTDNREHSLWNSVLEKHKMTLPTIHGEPGLVWVCGAKVVGDDTLVAALVPERDMTEVQDSGILHHFAILCTDVCKVLHVCIGQDLIVLLPGKGHRGAAAAGCWARETNVLAHHSHGRLRLGDDLWLWKVIWGREPTVRPPALCTRAASQAKKDLGQFWAQSSTVPLDMVRAVPWLSGLTASLARNKPMTTQSIKPA